ncbi:hypothetical protein LCGC14_2716940, partial [marine sediment metagenome]
MQKFRWERDICLCVPTIKNVTGEKIMFSNEKLEK